MTLVNNVLSKSDREKFKLISEWGVVAFTKSDIDIMLKSIAPKLSFGGTKEEKVQKILVTLQQRIHKRNLINLTKNSKGA